MGGWTADDKRTATNITISPVITRWSNRSAPSRKKITNIIMAVKFGKCLHLADW